jgi:hypothetical protein
MARSSRPPRPVQPVTLALQDLHVRQRFPGFSYRRVGGEVIWRGSLQPRATSPAYRVGVSYRVGWIPEVRVLWPALATGAPHLYSDGTLCLYWPKEWVWRSHELIAETIIPWTALWLFFYELWLDTGEWLGPSSHQTQASKSEGRDGS